MTALVCWIGVDQRGPASVYLASDSRISWRTSSLRTWDVGRKLFASSADPEILGYVGQVLFPSQALPQIIDLVDEGLLFERRSSPEVKRRAIFQVIRQQYDSYPVERDQPFTIIHCTRNNSKMNSSFHISTFSWDGSAWHEEMLDTPRHSTVVRAWGSGGDVVVRKHQEWVKAEGEGTSRNVFSAFCDALNSNEDRFTGGAPQLVGLYRIGPGRIFGVMYRGSRSLYGVPLHEPASTSSVEWRNELFERCDGQSGTRLARAQAHGRPRSLEDARRQS